MKYLLRGLSSFLAVIAGFSFPLEDAQSTHSGKWTAC
jgi:hypothetical protein